MEAESKSALCLSHGQHPFAQLTARVHNAMQVLWPLRQGTGRVEDDSTSRLCHS